MVQIDRPLSEVLVDFASPFFPLGWRQGPASSVQWILDFAAVIWDAATAGASTEDIVAQIGEGAHVPAEVEAMIGALVRRKQLLFASDNRLLAVTTTPVAAPMASTSH